MHKSSLNPRINPECLPRMRVDDPKLQYYLRNKLRSSIEQKLYATMGKELASSHWQDTFERMVKVFLASKEIAYVRNYTHDQIRHFQQDFVDEMLFLENITIALNARPLNEDPDATLNSIIQKFQLR